MPTPDNRPLVDYYVDVTDAYDFHAAHSGTPANVYFVAIGKDGPLAFNPIEVVIEQA
jgi:hypothetical protein